MWLLTFAGALLGMAVLQRLTYAAPVEARAAIALGFLVLAAHAGGEVARLLKAPRLAGVLIAAIAVGPSGLGLMRADELAALRFLATGALALLAYLAGTELQLRRLRARDEVVALGRMTVGVMLAPFLLVALVTLSIAPWFPVTAHQPLADAITVALFLGAAAAVSSPLLVLPLLDAHAASDAFSRRILDVSIAQDAAAVGLVVLVLGAAALLATPGAVQPGVLGQTIVLFGGSLLTGVALGYGITRFRVVLPERATLTLLAMALVIAAASRWFELEPTLLGLAAGITAAAGARGSARAAATVPTGVVFPVALALVAVGLDLGVLRTLWPWVLLFAGLRITALRAGLLWAGRDPRIDGTVVERGWLGLVGQAGVALTLASLARRAFPEWGISLEALLVAMIGVHAVAGPLLFDWVLGLTREGPEGAHGAKSGLAMAGDDRRGAAGL